jgi:hypothetical protein
MDKKAVRQKFIDNTVERFTNHLKRVNEPYDPVLLIQWLIDKKFIPEEEIKIELVVEESMNISICQQVSKTKAVRTIEAVYGIPESTCFYILDKHQRRHQ